MIGRWKVLALHAKLEVSLSGSACSHSLYLPHALSPYAVRSTSCGGHTRMIGRWKVLSPHAELKAGQSGSKCAPVPCGKGKGGGKHGAPAPYPVYGKGGGWNLPTLRAPLKFGQSEDACSPILCPPHTLSLRFSIFIIPSKGVWGHCPHVYQSP